MKKICSISIFLLLSNLNLYSKDLKDMLSTSKLLSTTTLNIDYNPSTLTIFYSKDLKQLGVRNLHEILDLTNEFQSLLKTTGTRYLSIRGDAQSKNVIYDKVKFFLDGVDININYYSDFPINLIERVEIFNENSSTLYGQGAFLTAINDSYKINYSNGY